jgi:hypothetical protein
MCGHSALSDKNFQLGIRVIQRLSIAVLLLCSSLLGSSSLSSGTGQSSRTLPNTSAFKNLNNWRAEIRIHDFTFNDSYQSIIGTNSFVVQMNYHNPGVLIRSWRDGSQSCTAGIPDVRTDIIVRVQRDAANSRFTVEVWNAIDGGGYLQAACTITQPGSPNDAGGNVSLGGFLGALAYARIYSTVVPLGTAPSNTFNGDLLDYEFEGNGTDRSSTGVNFSLNSPVYGTTPAYPPAPIFGQYGQPRTFAAGSGSIVLNGSSSFTSADNGTLQYFWQQVGGPSQGTFDNNTSVQTNFTAPLSGTYSIQLTVTDNNGLKANKLVKIGAVAVDANGIVITGNPTLDYVLGPLTMWGTSPWPWYDFTEMATANALAPYQTKYPDAGTKLSGTINIPAQNQYGHLIVTGVDTHFTTELQVGNYVGFQWNTPDGLQGIILFGVESITDDTHMTMDRQAGNWPIPQTGLDAYKLDASQYIFWGGSQSVSTNWNFYDNVLALYRLYYRTGIDDYLTQARTLADGWYHYALNHGYNVQYPMYAGLDGLIVRALDGKPEYWTGIVYYLRYPIGWTYQFTQGPVAPGSQMEPRNAGYALRAAALVARLHPTSPVRNEFCGYVSNAVRNVWPNVQDDLGNFEEDVYASNASYPYKAYNGRYGSSPWRATLALLGLQQAFNVLSDTAACNNQAAANVTLPLISKFSDFVHDYGTGSSRGQLYSVGFETLGQEPLAYNGFNAATPHTVGTLSVTKGSNIVTGNGTNFLTVFWNVPGATNGQQAVRYGSPVTRPTKYIGIPASGCRQVFQVASVQSDTQLTLTQPWTCPSESNIGPAGVGWVATWEADKECGPSLSTYCEGGPAGSRDLTHDIHAAYMWVYTKTGVAKYKSWAEDSMGADYGGSAGGPGTNGPAGGPNADGGHGNFWDALPVCGTPPCGGNGAANAQGKPFGMSAGAGNAPNALAYLMGPPQPYQGQSTKLTFVLKIPGATHVRYTFQAGNGVKNQVICNTSPCEVILDARYKTHLATPEYLDANGKVLSKGDPVRVILDSRP